MTPRFDRTIGPTRPRTAARPESIVVKVAEFAVAVSRDTVLMTHVLGSGLAVCLWDAEARVGGLLHCLLPDAGVNPDRARIQPASFADTGIPLLLQAAAARGLEARRCLARLVGGAEMAGLAGAGSLNVGKRNVLAARGALWRCGVMTGGESTGGHVARGVALRLDDGLIEVTSGHAVIQTL